MKSRTVIFTFLLVGAFCLTASNTLAKNVRGVTDTEVKLGCLVDFSGPGKFAGPPLSMGAQAYIRYANAQGTIHGRRIRLVVEDNGILPSTTLAAAKKVIFKDEILAIGFNLGSIGTSAIIPLCEENGVVLMPHGANRKFYYPGNKWVFVPHATQYNMAARAVEYIVEKNPKARMGIIYQDDDFGRDGLGGARAAAKFMNTKLVAEAPYKIGTIDLSPQVRMMKEANVDYILMWSFLPQVGFVLKAKQKMAWDVKVIGNNTTAYRLLFPLAKQLADGYLCVTPFLPWEDIPQKVKGIVKKHSDYEKVATPPFPAPMYLACWTYFMAMVEGVKNAGRDLTPESLLKGIEGIKDLDTMGMCPKMTFGPKRHVGYFSSMVLKADAKNMRFVVESPIREPKTPQL
ncbi:MAG: ABC transporter substrate-binding protein [Desulfobacteraceae bacterium]|jgi:branched-chain amino acid transport system substrate-binding protein